jgi:dsDNA-specific endonuclease/ATPase MutS2
MANPLYNQYRQPINDNGLSQIIEQAKQMRKTFNGNPQQVVQNLLNSGRMSQSQFNQLSQIANQVVQAMGNDI